MTHKHHSSCPSPYHLDRLHTGEATASEQRAYSEHLPLCPTCQAHAEKRQQQIAELHNTPLFQTLLQQGLALTTPHHSALSATNTSHAASTRSDSLSHTTPAHPDSLSHTTPAHPDSLSHTTSAHSSPFPRASSHSKTQTSTKPHTPSFWRWPWLRWTASGTALAMAAFLLLLRFDIAQLSAPIEPPALTRHPIEPPTFPIKPPNHRNDPSKASIPPNQTSQTPKASPLSNQTSQTPKGNPRTPKGKAPTFRMLYFSKGSQHSQYARNGQVLFAGDLIQFTADTPHDLHAMILSVNAQGQTTVVIPYTGTQSRKIQAGTQRLPSRSSLELDDERGLEAYLFLTSQMPFDAQQAKQSVIQAFARAGRDLLRLDIRSALFQTQIFLIQKQAHTSMPTPR